MLQKGVMNHGIWMFKRIPGFMPHYDSKFLTFYLDGSMDENEIVCSFTCRTGDRYKHELYHMLITREYVLENRQTVVSFLFQILTF